MTPHARRGWIVLAGAAGFFAGFLTVFTIFITVDVRPGCDGPCFDNPWWPGIAYGTGALCAILFSFAAWRLSRRYFVKPS